MSLQNTKDRYVPSETREEKWDCPVCGHLNTDIRSDTAVPLCEGCLSDVEWYEIDDQAEDNQ